MSIVLSFYSSIYILCITYLSIYLFIYLLFCIHLLLYASFYSFDNLRIRRLKKTESTPKGASFSKGPKGRCKHDEKQAHLLFTATIKTDTKTVVLKALSQPIYLSKLLK